MDATFKVNMKYINYDTIREYNDVQCQIRRSTYKYYKKFTGCSSLDVLLRTTKYPQRVKYYPLGSEEIKELLDSCVLETDGSVILF